MTDTAGGTMAKVALTVLGGVLIAALLGVAWMYNQTTLNAAMITIHASDISDMKIKQESQVLILAELAKSQARSEILLQQLVDAHKPEAPKGP